MIRFNNRIAALEIIAKDCLTSMTNSEDFLEQTKLQKLYIDLSVLLNNNIDHSLIIIEGDNNAIK